MKVLVTDDEDEVREILAERLRHAGFDVTEARNGLECLAQVKHDRPDAVVLDLRMPRVQGMEALRHIHRFDPTITVIVLTALDSATVHAEARALGARAVFTKPCRFEDLVAALAPPDPGGAASEPHSPLRD